MEFFNISHRDLVEYNKYKVIFHGHTYIGRYSKVCPAYIVLIQVTYKSDKIPFINIPLSANYLLYEPLFKKKQIQQDMERRAVNMIVQRILGDPYFQW